MSKQQLTIDEAKKTRPYLDNNIKFWNVHKETGASIYLIPAIHIYPYTKTEKVNKAWQKYESGCFEESIVIMFSFLFWEIAFNFRRKNYKYPEQKG